MPKIGNYVQRDYHSRYRSQKKSTWSDYNKSWASRRQASAQKMQQLRTIASSFNVIGLQAYQANTMYVMQNQGSLGGNANQTAAMARVNILV